MLEMLLAITLAASPAPVPVPDPPARILPKASPAVDAETDEPTVGEIQGAAARWADPATSGAGAPARARAAALLPTLTAELRVDERSYRVVGLQASGEVDYARYAPGWLAAVRATWDLAALVLPPSERIDAKGALDRARRRDEAVRRATGLYFERRRLQLQLQLGTEPPASPRDRAQAELELERLAAELDALTGGAFTRRRP
jgi:hypothetical protein